MLASNLPVNIWDATGVSFPSGTDMIVGAVADMQQAFNNELNLDAGITSTLNTPQGQIASSEAQIRLAVNADLANIPAILNPNTTYGVFQDSMGLFFYNQVRLPALPTTVDILCTGLVGVTIPAGVQVQSINGDIYQSVQSGVISGGGTITISFACTVTGAIMALAGTVNAIYNAQGVTGWDSATNPADGIPGQAVETPQAFEARRKLTLGNNGHSQTSTLRGVAYSVAGVSNVFAYDNFTGAPVTYLSVTVPAHSIFVAVVGGTDAAVAAALLSKKGGGCGWYGNTSVNVQDTDLYNPPYPTYTVSFERPASLPIYFTVTAVDDITLPFNRTDLVKNAIIEQFKGTNGADRETMASLIQSGKYFAPIQAAIPAIVMHSIAVDITASPLLFSYQVAMNKFPTISAVNIVVSWV